MADKYIKGVAEALGRAGAAMTDATQGTSFYKDIQERDKEERLTQLALEKEQRDRDFMREQMAAEKQQLNNENAVRATSSLVTTFSDRVNTLLGNPFQVTNGQADQLLRDGEAYVNRIATQQNLSDSDREIFAAQINAMMPSLENVKLNASANQAATLPTLEQRFEAARELSMPALMQFYNRPKPAADLAMGEQTFATLLATTPEASDSELSRVLKLAEQYDTRTFADLALADPALAAEIIKFTPAEIKSKQQKNTFVNTALPNLKAATRESFNQLPSGLGTHLDVDFQKRLDALFTEDNIVQGKDGFIVQGLSEFIDREMKPVLEGLSSLSRKDLLLLDSQKESYRKMYGDQFANRITQELVTKKNRATPTELVRDAMEVEEANMENLEATFALPFDEEAEIDEDPGVDPLAGAATAGVMGFAGAGLLQLLAPWSLPATLPWWVGASAATIGGLATGDPNQNFRGQKAKALSNQTKSLYAQQSEQIMLREHIADLESEKEFAYRIGNVGEVQALTDQINKFTGQMAVYDSNVPKFLLNFIHEVSNLEFLQDNEEQIKNIFLTEIGQTNLESDVVGISTLSGLNKNNMFEKLTTFFALNSAEIGKIVPQDKKAIDSVIKDSREDLRILLERFKEMSNDHPKRLEEMPDLIGYDLSNEQDPILTLLTNLLLMD